MNNNIKNTLRKGLMVAAGMVAMYSCTDTWEDHYNAPVTLSYDGTTMQAIAEKAPDFAQIIKHVGFDRELNSENFYTIWAPATIEDKEYWLSQDSATVVDRLIKNHIARSSYSFTGVDVKDILLMSQKKVDMTADGKFNLSEITNPNLSCSNGVLHVIDSANKYKNNLFEEIQEQYNLSQCLTKDSVSLYKFLIAWDADSLDEDRSVYRGVDADGNRIYVDSVTIRNNTQLKNVDALIYREDSNYIAIIPTVEAYQERYNMAKDLLVFNPYEDVTSAGACDSLQNHYAHMFAMSDLYFNKNANEHYQDSLKSTIFDRKTWPNNVYYNATPQNGLHPEKHLNNILEKCGDPISCSNGDAYLVDEYPMNPYEQFFKTIHVWATNRSVDMTTDGSGSPRFTKSVNTSSLQPRNGSVNTYIYDTNVDEETGDTTRNLVTIVRENYRFTDFVPSSSAAQPNFAFQIPNTLSGDYDIYIVTCPIWMKNVDLERRDRRTYRFNAYIYEREDDGKNIGQYPSTGVQLRVPETTDPKYLPFMGESSGKEFITTPNYNEYGLELTTDTLYLGNYQFKNAYYSRVDEGVLLQIRVNVTNKLTTTHSREMLVSEIILRPRGDEGYPVTIPATEAKGRKKNYINISKITK